MDPIDTAIIFYLEGNAQQQRARRADVQGRPAAPRPVQERPRGAGAHGVAACMRMMLILHPKRAFCEILLLILELY